ncbi:putative E3 ubiquitin-protein ligase SINA-like 6 [Triticum dicoccoides]|uniref:putative E3 ubiquitin-protein ligase SINA-like 6 n=1 Tax=Triticum dicoccoides TaxID=85692 RepID=UPI0018904830|nr:putative E3 ubiquitin-protein ligase SINA-like 6 [Triticum dicoccoides]
MAAGCSVEPARNLLGFALAITSDTEDVALWMIGLGGGRQGDTITGPREAARFRPSNEKPLLLRSGGWAPRRPIEGVEEAMGKRQEREKDEGGDGKRRKVAAAAPVFTMDDLDILHCAVCCDPLRPPISQCSTGRHTICSSCQDKLPGKCCYCCETTVYSRCRGIENMIESLKVACPNNGCTARIKYYQKEEHEEVCPQAPCFCPIADCSFSGPTATLLEHFSSKDKLDSTKVSYNKGFGILISFNVNGDLPEPTILVGEDGYLFIVYMKTESLGLGIAVCCVQPHITTGSKFKCNLSLSSAETGYSQATEFHTRNTNLYDGFPDDCFLFLVPKAMLPGAGTSDTVLHLNLCQAVFRSDLEIDLIAKIDRGVPIANNDYMAILQTLNPAQLQLRR